MIAPFIQDLPRNHFIAIRTTIIAVVVVVVVVVVVAAIVAQATIIMHRKIQFNWYYDSCQNDTLAA